MCAQIERNPRQGVELFNTCGAPTKRAEFAGMCACSIATAVMIGAALAAIAFRVAEVWP